MANTVVINNGGLISAEGGNGQASNAGNGINPGAPGVGGAGANGYVFVEIVP